MRHWRLSAVVYTSKSSNYGCGNDVPLKQDRATPKQTLRVKESSLENVPSCETSGRRAARVIRDWLACPGLIKSGAAACTPARQLRNHVLADTRLYHHTPLSSHSSCQGAAHVQRSLVAATWHFSSPTVWLSPLSGAGLRLPFPSTLRSFPYITHIVVQRTMFDASSADRKQRGLGEHSPRAF
jgi:hypothetical protein